MMVYLNPENLERVDPKIGDILIQLDSGTIGGKLYVSSRLVKVVNMYIQAGEKSISTLDYNP